VAILQAIRIISFREVDMVDILDVSGQWKSEMPP
jgi:hypothetical protein